MPVAKSTAPTQYTTLIENAPAAPTTVRGFWGDLADTYGIGVYGQIKDTFDRLQAGPRDPNFEPLNNIPQGYEQYAVDLRLAESQEDMNIMVSNIDENNAIRARQNEYSFGYNLLLGAITGVVDPVNLFGPTVKGVTFLKGALKGGIAYGSINAGQEIVRHRLDPTSTNLETGVNISAGYLLAGLFTGAAAHFGRTEIGATPISREADETAQRLGDNYDKAVSEGLDGYNIADTMQFDPATSGRGDIKIVLGNTGKYDRNGNYIPAFFRSAESAAEMARRTRVQKAADDALGDVIPDAIAEKAMREIDAAVEKAIQNGDLAVTSQAKIDPVRGISNDIDRARARAIDPARENSFWNDLSPDVQEFLGKRQARDAETGEIHLGFDTIRGTHMFDLWEEAAQKQLSDIEGLGKVFDETFEDMEDVIYLDDAYILSRFDQKPWTNPRDPDIIPFPEDAFKTAEEYLEFVKRHEMHHSTTKRLPNESKAEYENRINTLAYDDIKASRSSLSPSRGFIQDLLLKYFYQGQATTLAGDHPDVHRLLQEVGGDMSTLNNGNKMNLPTTPGGSVYQKGQRWLLAQKEFQDVHHKAYLEYLTGEKPGSKLYTTAALETRKLRPSSGKMTLEEFNEYVGRASQTDHRFEMHGKPMTDAEHAIAMRSAQVLRQLFKRFGDEAEMLGMFDVRTRIKKDIAWREKNIAKNDEELLELEARFKQIEDEQKRVGRWLKPKELQPFLKKEMDEVLEREAKAKERGDPPYDPGFFPDGKPKRMPSLEARARGWLKGKINHKKKYNARVRDEIAELQARDKEISGTPVSPKKEKYYFARIYNLEEIRARLDEFTEIITKHFANNADEGTRDYDLAKVRATEWIDKLINGGSEDDFAPGAGGPINTKSRQITLTNEELADFIIWDADLVLGVYARRMGPSIEMVRAFGSRTLDEALDGLRERLRTDGFAEKRIEKIIRLQEDVRDRVLGRFHAKPPTSWDNRVVRAISNLTNTTLMGGGVFSQVNDIGRAIALTGHEPLFKALKTAMNGEFEKLSQGVYAPQGGEALELVNASSVASMIEYDSAMMITNQTRAERFLARAQPTLFKYNLMNPFNVLWKKWFSLMAAHIMIEESTVIAKAIRSGKTLETLSAEEGKMLTRLNSWGIDLRSAQLIADMPYETTARGLHIANIENWSGRKGGNAKEIFLGALNGQIRTGIVTPGPLQRNNIMDGVFYWKGERQEWPLLGLPFKLMSFIFASSAKVSHSLLSGRERSRAGTLGALLVSGMFATWLKSNTHDIVPDILSPLSEEEQDRKKSRWEYMSWSEFALESLDNSAIMGYFSDVYNTLDDLTGYGPRSAVSDFDPSGGSVSGKLGSVGGPGVSVIAGGIEAFINPDLPDRTKASLIKRTIPFNNMFFWNDTLKEWANWAVDAGILEDSAPTYTAPPDEEAATETEFSPLMPQE